MAPILIAMQMYIRNKHINEHDMTNIQLNKLWCLRVALSVTVCTNNLSPTRFFPLNICFYPSCIHPIII